MSIVHKSRSGETTQDILVPSSAEPIMARAAAPPPFQLFATTAELEEEVEGPELLPETAETSLILADDDPAEGAPSAGGDGSGGSTGTSDAGTDPGSPEAGSSAPATIAPVTTAPDLSILNEASGGEVLPELVIANVKTLSGYDLSGVKVNYNSAKPQLLRAGGYAKGLQIELAPGHESFLATAVWAIVQQMQGLVPSTRSIQGMEVNDDSTLAVEAESKGGKAVGATGRLMRTTKSTVQTKAQGEGVPPGDNELGLVILPDSFRELDEFGNVIEPLAGEVETEPLNPIIPESTVVEVPEIDLTLGYDNLKAITNGSVADTLGISLDFLRSVVFDLTLKFSFYLGIKVEVLEGLFGVAGGFLLEGAATLNQQDDRLVRAGWSLSYGGRLTTTLLWFIEHSSTWMTTNSKASVYQDMAHFSAHQYGSLSGMVDEVAQETDEVEQLPQSSHDGEGRSMDALLGASPTDVSSSIQSTTHGVEASSSGVGVGYEHNKTSNDMTFYRGEGDEREVRKGTQEDESHSGTVTVGKTELTITRTKTIIKNHANEDNDGSYINWSITLQNRPQNSTEFITRFGNMMNTIIEGLNTLNGKLSTGAFDTSTLKGVKDLFNIDTMNDLVDSDMPTGKPSGGIDNYYTAEFNYVEFSETVKVNNDGETVEGSNGVEMESDEEIEKTQMVLQYLRISQGTAVSMGNEIEIPIPALSNGVVSTSIEASFSASVDFSSAVLEVTSGDTITYFMTVYNGLVYTDEQVESGFAPSKEGGWVAFRTQHRAGLDRLIKNMANTDSVPFKEVYGYFDAHPEAVIMLFDAIVAYSKGETDLDTCIACLENLFAENYIRKGEDAEKTSWGEGGFEDPEARSPWAKAASGSSEYSVDVTKSGNFTLNRNAFDPGNADNPTPPRSIVESLLQAQDVKCSLKIPYYEYTRGRVNGRNPGAAPREVITDHTSDKEINIPKLTNRVQANELIAQKFLDVWGETPERIPSTIRYTHFKTSGLSYIYSEVKRLQSASIMNSSVGRGGPEIRRQLQEQVDNYFDTAKDDLKAFVKSILTENIAETDMFDNLFDTQASIVSVPSE